MHQRARGYLERLCELMLRMEVTSQDGTEHDLDAGARLAVKMVLSVQSSGGKVMIAGNGGSDAIASHLQTDLCNAVGVKALALNGSGMLTALSNDHGYGCVFERPIRLWGDTDDLLIAISSSGRSDNILRAVEAARSRGCKVVTLSGFRADNPLRKTGDLNFYVPSETYGFVEVAHTAVAHFIVDSTVVLRLQEVPRVTTEVWTPSQGF